MKGFHWSTKWLVTEVHRALNKINIAFYLNFSTPRSITSQSPLSALSHSRDVKLNVWQFYSCFNADIFTNNSECLPGYSRLQKTVQILTVGVIFVDEPSSCQTVSIAIPLFSTWWTLEWRHGQSRPGWDSHSAGLASAENSGLKEACWWWTVLYRAVYSPLHSTTDHMLWILAGTCLSLWQGPSHTVLPFF